MHSMNNVGIFQAIFVGPGTTFPTSHLLVGMYLVLSILQIYSDGYSFVQQL